MKFNVILKQITLNNKKLKQRDYKNNGKLPVIGQGNEFINGYTNRTDLKIKCDFPMIIFGDHTRKFKYIEFDFVAGADGIKVLQPLSIFNSKLIYYFCKSINLPNKGYARHYKYLNDFLIPIPPLNEQKRILTEIELIFTQIDMAENYQKSILIMLNKLKTSVFKQAFDGCLVPQDPKDESTKILLKKLNLHQTQNIMPKNIPKGWTYVSLSTVAELNPKKPKYNEKFAELDVSFIPMKCVAEQTGKINACEIKKYSNVKNGYTYFKNDDIIFAKITPCMENGKIALVKNLRNNLGFGSTEFHVIRLHNIIHKKFYLWYLLQENIRNIARDNMQGTVGQLRLPIDYLKNIVIPFPPINEQKRIATKIESIFDKIVVIEKRIDLIFQSLNMLKQSVLKQAFEGKLVYSDPNDESVELYLKKHNLTI